LNCVIGTTLFQRVLVTHLAVVSSPSVAAVQPLLSQQSFFLRTQRRAWVYWVHGCRTAGITEVRWNVKIGTRGTRAVMGHKALTLNGLASVAADWEFEELGKHPSRIPCVLTVVALCGGSAVMFSYSISMSRLAVSIQTPGQNSARQEVACCAPAR